jgi:hypothetical protein
MKSFTLLKIAVPLLGFGAVLLFTPSCRAQSEISPDHFDGTDAWETAARTPARHTTHAPAPKNQVAKTPASAQSTLQLASDRQRSAPQRREAVAIPEKRKPAVRKSEKQ